MKYVCLNYHLEKEMSEMSREEGEALIGRYSSFTREIQEGGQFVAGEALQPVSTATTVRVRNGKVSMTDGPFAETREQLGGIYFIEARDLDEALQIAARIPAAETGSIEVRPVIDFSQA